MFTNALSVIQSHAGKRVLIAPHTSPDGDSIGAMLALGYVCETLGYDICLFLTSGVPHSLEWLSLPWRQVATLGELGDWIPHLVVVVDCGDAARTGSELKAFFEHNVAPGWEQTASLCIDHHVSDAPFAQHNWIDPAMPAAGMMVGLLAEACGVPLSGAVGEAVYLCLVSDTGNFTFSNTTQGAFAMASRILAGGLNVAEFTERHENHWTLQRMHLWGALMTEVTLHGGGTVACCIVTQAMLRQSNCTKDDLEGFVGWLRRLQGVRVALFVREDGAARSKISLRSMGDVDVRVVAAHFGGGGHVAASGVEMHCAAAEAGEQVLERLLEQMRS